jgi:DNA-binding beta-propeller fold protein YncE
MIRRLLALFLVAVLAPPASAVDCPLTRAQYYFPTNQAAGMAQRPDGRILVADTYRFRVLEFSESLSLIAIHTFAGSDYALYRPAGIAVDAAGYVYIADQARHLIVKCDPAMTPIATWGTQGSGPGQLNLPTNLAFSPDGSRLYVTELGGNRVSMFTPTGEFIGGWGSLGTAPGQFDHPFGIAVDAVGNVLVADVLNSRVQVFTGDGVYLSSFGTLGGAPGQFNQPAGLYFDSSWNLYVADQLNNRIQKLTATGEPICELPQPFQYIYFNQPWFAGPLRDGSVLVGDTYNSMVEMFVLGATPTRTTSWGAVKTLYR